MKSPFRVVTRIALGLVLAVGLVVASASGAQAHVHTTPSVVKPGRETTVTFTISHGCAGSPTTKVAIKIPSGVTGVAAIAPKGFVGSVKAWVATFTGSLPDKAKGGFALTFTAPKTEGILRFPTIQTCAKGVNSWIEAPRINGKESQYPAPYIEVSSTKAKSSGH